MGLRGLGLGLAARLLIIGLSLLLALWIGLIALLYWSNGLTRAISTPTLDQLPAALALIRMLPEDRRPLALEALNTPLLTTRIAPRSELPPGRDLRGDPIYDPYSEALGADLLALRAGEDMLRGARLFDRTRRPLELWIALDAETALVADLRLPFVITVYGLPVGLLPGLLGTIFAGIAFVLLHREIRPLTRLAAAVDRIEPSGEQVPLPALRARTPEIRALLRAFDRLQTRLHAMTRSRMALIGGIQHDLRSFATRLRLRLETLPDPQDRARATAEINDMIGLLDNALLTSRAGVGALDEELLDLGELLGAELSDFRREGLPVTLELRGRAPFLVIGDRLALRRVLGNLVGNAVTYGTRAELLLIREGEEFLLLIRDRGPGFPPEMQALLLEPFVRAEPSRSRHTGGAGLGLAVARALIEAQGGTLSLGAAPHGGGEVCLRLPRFVPG